MEKIILIGGGGHCRVLIDAIRKNKQFRIAGIIDKKDNAGREISGCKIIGTDEDLKSLYDKGINKCFISVGSIGNPKIRISLKGKAESIGFIFPLIIHPNSVIADDVKIGSGTFVAAGSIINPGVKIGSHCIINTGAVIDHDCEIGDFSHIAPGAVLSGKVKIGNNTHIGAGAVVIQQISIGEDTIIGAGSIVVKNINGKSIAFGSPCRYQRKNDE